MNRRAPQILIGHSLGGAAVLAVAGALSEVRAVITIAAPSDLGQVAHLFAEDLPQIEADGEAQVLLGGRTFAIRKQFVDDLRTHNLSERVATMKKPFLILHSPRDEIVGIEHAEQLFAAARHPKSYVSLDQADHLLTNRADATYAARVIARVGGAISPRREWPSRGAQASSPGRRGGDHARDLPQPRRRPASTTSSPTSRSRPAASVRGRHRTIFSPPPSGPARR